MHGKFHAQAGPKPFVFFYYSYATGKSMEISMYKAGTNFLIIFFVYHATGKSMEISMYKAGTNFLIIFFVYHATVNPRKFPCTRLEQTY